MYHVNFRQIYCSQFFATYKGSTFPEAELEQLVAVAVDVDIVGTVCAVVVLVLIFRVGWGMEVVSKLPAKIVRSRCI